MPRVQAPNVKFECLLCGRCCADHPNRKRTVVLTERDMTMICGRTGLATKDFCMARANNQPFRYIMRMKGGRCAFFLENGRCEIYDVRPLVCRAYPFSFKAVGDSILFQVDPECPGIGRGNYLGRNHFLQIINLAGKLS